MKCRWQLLFSIGIVSLLILAPSSVLAQSSSCVSWSKICEEGKKLIEKELNLTGVPHKIYLEYSRNITFGALIVPNGIREKIKAIVLLYKLLIGSGSKAMNFLAIVSFENEKGKIIPIGVQIFRGNLQRLENTWKPLMRDTMNSWAIAQIPEVAPKAPFLFYLSNIEMSPMNISQMPLPISSKLAPAQETLKIFENALNKYSKEWWGPASPKAVVNTNLCYFDWGSTRYLSGIPFQNMYSWGIDTCYGITNYQQLTFYPGVSSILFPQESSGSFSVYSVNKFMDSKGTVLPGWSIDYALLLMKERKPVYISIHFSGEGPVGNESHLPTLPELNSTVRQAFFEILHKIAKEINSPEMNRTYQSLLHRGYAFLGGKECVLYERAQTKKEYEGVVIVLGSRQSPFVDNLPFEVYLTVSVHYVPSKKELAGFGQFLFSVNDWSYFFPNEVVNYGGPSKALKVAREALGNEESNVISQNIFGEKGVLWGNKIYRVYFVETEVKTGLFSENIYASQVFLGRVIKNFPAGSLSLSASQIVVMDWYVIFPPIIGFGCIIGGTAYWRRRKGRREGS